MVINGHDGKNGHRNEHCYKHGHRHQHERIYYALDKYGNEDSLPIIPIFDILV